MRIKEETNLHDMRGISILISKHACRLGQWQQHLFTLQVTAIDISQSGCYQPTSDIKINLCFLLGQILG